MYPIIDAHTHIWPDWVCGSENRRFHVRYLPYGRVRMGNGEICQMLPEYFHDTAFNTETLIELMNGNGIERAVILQGLNVFITPDLVEAVRRYPERLRGAIAVELNDPAPEETIEKAHEGGLSVLKFELSAGLGYTNELAYPDFDFAAPVFERIFGTAERLGMTVTVDTSPITGKGYQVEALRAAIRAYPGLRFVICHLGFPYIGLREDAERYARWKDMLRLSEHDNVWFDISTLNNLFGVEGYPLSITDRAEEYPYPTALSFVREYLDLYGPHKAIWGSDIPSSLGSATYGQMIGMFRNSPLFSDAEKKAMFYDNAIAAYFAATP